MHSLEFGSRLAVGEKERERGGERSTMKNLRSPPFLSPPPPPSERSKRRQRSSRVRASVPESIHFCTFGGQGIVGEVRGGERRRRRKKGVGFVFDVVSSSFCFLISASHSPLPPCALAKGTGETWAASPRRWTIDRSQLGRVFFERGQLFF